MRTPGKNKYSKVTALSLCKNVADARFEKTSPSADVLARVPYGIFVFSKLFVDCFRKVTQAEKLTIETGVAKGGCDNEIHHS